MSAWDDENRWYARLMRLAHELAMEGRGQEAHDLRVAATHARLEPGLDALRIACDDAMVLYTPAFDHPRTKPVAVIEASGVDDVQVEAASESLDDKVDAMREAIFEMHDKILRKKQGA